MKRKPNKSLTTIRIGSGSSPYFFLMEATDIITDDDDDGVVDVVVVGVLVAVED